MPALNRPLRDTPPARRGGGLVGGQASTHLMASVTLVADQASYADVPTDLLLPRWPRGA
ncbi:MAG: hypothetical protein IPH43_04075 [Xanthomonadales bacterium]|nr:hypothetical protein [Xanthomonadales bacterium]